MALQSYSFSVTVGNRQGFGGQDPCAARLYNASVTPPGATLTSTPPDHVCYGPPDGMPPSIPVTVSYDPEANGYQTVTVHLDYADPGGSVTQAHYVGSIAFESVPPGTTPGPGQPGGTTTATLY